MRQRPDIDYLLEEIITLPSLPGIVTRVIELLDAPSTSLEEVGKVISTDPALTLKTLRLANSAHYGVRERLTSVEQATVFLGEKVIKNLVYAATVFDTLRKSTDALLRHSISCGLAMEVLVSARGPDIPLRTDEAFVYGLLHDIGKVVFEEFLPEEYGKAVSLARERHLAIYQAEREVIGVDHGELGARLAEKWRLAEKLVNAIAGHHDLSKCHKPEAAGLAALLSVADYICCASGIVVEPRAVTVVADDAWKQTCLEGKDMPPALARFFTALPMVDELLTIAG